MSSPEAAWTPSVKVSSALQRVWRMPSAKVMGGHQCWHASDASPLSVRLRHWGPPRQFDEGPVLCDSKSKERHNFEELFQFDRSGAGRTYPRSGEAKGDGTPLNAAQCYIPRAGAATAAASAAATTEPHVRVSSEAHSLHGLPQRVWSSAAVPLVRSQKDRVQSAHRRAEVHNTDFCGETLEAEAESRAARHHGGVESMIVDRGEFIDASASRAQRRNGGANRAEQTGHRRWIAAPRPCGQPQESCNRPVCTSPMQENNAHGQHHPNASVRLWIRKDNQRDARALFHDGGEELVGSNIHSSRRASRRAKHRRKVGKNSEQLFGEQVSGETWYSRVDSDIGPEVVEAGLHVAHRPISERGLGRGGCAVSVADSDQRLAANDSAAQAGAHKNHRRRRRGLTSKRPGHSYIDKGHGSAHIKSSLMHVANLGRQIRWETDGSTFYEVESEIEVPKRGTFNASPQRSISSPARVGSREGFVGHCDIPVDLDLENHYSNQDDTIDFASAWGWWSGSWGWDAWDFGPSLNGVHDTSDVRWQDSFSAPQPVESWADDLEAFPTKAASFEAATAEDASAEIAPTDDFPSGDVPSEVVQAEDLASEAAPAQITLTDEVDSRAARAEAFAAEKTVISYIGCDGDANALVMCAEVDNADEAENLD